MWLKRSTAPSSSIGSSGNFEVHHHSLNSIILCIDSQSTKTTTQDAEREECGRKKWKEIRSLTFWMSFTWRKSQVSTHFGTQKVKKTGLGWGRYTQHSDKIEEKFMVGPENWLIAQASAINKLLLTLNWM